MHHQITPRRPIRIRRRSLLTGFAVTAVAGWAGQARAARHTPALTQADALPADLMPPQGATFVGPTSDPAALVGIVFPNDDPGAVVGYLCRGPELNFWFTGEVNGDAIALNSPALPDTEPEPALTASRDGDRITGEIALPERVLTFTAIPADGIAGLYVTERDEAGSVRGASSTGATVQARQVMLGAGAEDAPFQITGTVTAADGRRFELVIPARTEGAALFRWVALASGRVVGAGRRREANVQGTVKFAVEQIGL